MCACSVIQENCSRENQDSAKKRRFCGEALLPCIVKRSDLSDKMSWGSWGARILGGVLAITSSLLFAYRRKIMSHFVRAIALEMHRNSILRRPNRIILIRHG